MNAKRTRTVFAVLLAALSMLTLAVLMTACNDKTPPATPVKLILDYDDVKVDYLYDEPFTYSGLKVKTEMSDGSTVDVPSGYKVTPPDMSPGQHMVTVTYGALTAKYPIFVEDITKVYDDADAFVVKGAGVYTARASGIDLQKCEASPLDVNEPFVKRTSSVFSSGDYLSNIGVEGNCVGLAFSADAEYEGVTLAVTLGNLTDADIVLSDAITMYFGFAGGDDTGELDLSGKTLEAGGFDTLVFDGLSVYGGGNFIVEFTNECDLAFDGIELIVGADDVHADSRVDLTVASTEPKVLEVEDMNTTRLVTDGAVVAENELKFGQPMLKDVGDGKYVSDFETGTKISAVLNLDADANVEFTLRADMKEAYALVDNWKFTLDTFVFDGADRSAADGWTDVALGTYPVKAGKHLFTAELIGAPCDVDRFAFAATEFDGQAGTLVEDVLFKDLTVYGFGTYKVEAEDMLDRSGWIPQFGTVDGMIESWRHKDGKSGVAIGKVGNKQVETEDGGKTWLNTELKFHFVLKTAAKLSLRMSVADNNAVEDGTIPTGRITTSVSGKKLTWSSRHKFGYDDAHTYWNFGEIVYSDVVLEPGEHTISTKTVGIGYDYYVLEFSDPTIDAYVNDFGTYRAEAENLLDRSGWIPNAGTVDEMVVGSYVTKIKPNSMFKVVFKLDKRAAVKFSARLSVWKYGSTGFQSSWMSGAKIDGTAITISGKLGTSFKDPIEGGSVNGWGIAESGFVTLEAGKHEVTWKSGDVSYDWFEIRAYDADAPLPEYTLDEVRSYKIMATGLATMKDCDKEYASDGFYVTRVNGKSFKTTIELTERSTVKISVRMSGWANASETYNPSWMVNPKFGNVDLTFVTQEGSNFKGSGLKWGYAECTVTLDAGIYEYSWKSGDASYYWLNFDVSAPTA